MFFLAKEDESTMHNSWLSLQHSEAAGWPPGLLLILCLIMRAHTESVLSLSISRPPGHHAITHFYGDLFFALWKLLMSAAGVVKSVWMENSCKLYWQEAKGNHLGRWCTVWGLIDWVRDPGVMQAEGHKHTVMFFATQALEYMKSRINTFNLHIFLICTPHLCFSPLWLGFMLVVIICSPDWITEHFISHPNQWERRENSLRLDLRTFSEAHCSQTWTHTCGFAVSAQAHKFQPTASCF